MSKTKKEPDVGTTDSISTDISSVSNSDNITETEKSQTFQQDADNYKQPVDDEKKGRHWLFIVYEDSAPEDWIEQLEATGISFAISPHHDKDVNPDGARKKPHYHVIVSYPNTTTYRNVKGLRTITKGPYPLPCGSVSGSYAYFTHKHNPEKYQYDSSEITRHNGWEKVLEASDVSHIMKELTLMCMIDDIREYSELIIQTMIMDGDYQQVAMSHTHFFDRFISSYRHAPERTLIRYYNIVDSDEEREMIAQRLSDLGLERNDEDESCDS